MRYSNRLFAPAIALFLGLSGCAVEDDTLEKSPQAISVQVSTSESGSITDWLFTQGTARAKNREYLTFENPGRIDMMLKGENGEDLREGSWVTKGTVLARQDQRTYLAELDTSRARAEQAGFEVTLARQNLERFEGLFERKSAAKLELEEAKSRVQSALSELATAQAQVKQAQVALEQTELIAPLDGLVAYINIEEGFYFTPGNVRTDSETSALESVPMVLIELNTFEVLIQIPSFRMRGIDVGDPVRLQPSLRGILPTSDSEFTDEEEQYVAAEIFSINPAITPGSRSVDVKVRTLAPDDRLQDGMFLGAWIAAETHDNTVLITNNALVFADDQAFVFTVKDGIATRVPVTLGLAGPKSQEIVKGLQPGVDLVTEGRYQITDGTPVRVLTSGNKAHTVAPGSVE